MLDTEPFFADQAGSAPVEIRTTDGALLEGRLFRPAGMARVAAVLHPAVGVTQGYYRAFADWLADQGIACLTYDYRDFGASARKPARQSGAMLTDWGIRDQAAAQKVLERLVPDLPLWVIGHSLGGLMLPFQEGAGRVDRLIAVASGPSHVSEHPWSYGYRARFFWSAPVAALVQANGSVPGRFLGAPTDLPAGVYAEWRRWCTSRGFYLGDIGHSMVMPDWGAMKGKAKFVAVADDSLVPTPAVWRLMQHYPEAERSQLTLRPSDFGLGQIGHIAVLGAQCRALWPAIVA